jgi:SAM-dependent methyltransferase
MILKRFASVYAAGGVRGVLSAVWRRARTPHARSLPRVRSFVHGAIGMEIGGPSALFARGGLIPIYPMAERVDNCNFAASTLWEDRIVAGDSFAFQSGKAPGRQFILEGADLKDIPSGSYDFVLSSNMLEHTANPLHALHEWKRLLRPGGGLILVVPHRDGTFDHRRPVTSIDHLLGDYERGTGEDDLTHLEEIVALHDLALDPAGEDIVQFRRRAERNPEIRSLHHHVFDTRLAVAAVEAAGFEPVAVEPLRPYNILVVARRPRDGSLVPAADPIDLESILRGSPFPTDRA